MSDDELQIFNEAVQNIRFHSLLPQQQDRITVGDILKTYLQTFDPYADHLTSREYAAFLLSTENDYFGVQMDIRKTDSVVYLYPFPDGVAEQAGIRIGDELIAIDGMPVYGTSLYLVGARIRGEDGTTVQLTIRTGAGIPRIHTLRRQPTHYRSISVKEFDHAFLIRISRFSKDTGDHLGQFLTTHHEQKIPLLIDLRGNQGGSLASARQCAEFFLPREAKIYQLRTNKDTVTVGTTTTMSAGNPIIILQDQATASAAETFIAALVQNGRAISVGNTSYGKGLVQKFLPLSDGSALLLSYAEIITPCGMSFNGKGLVPIVHLPDVLLDKDFSQETMQSVLFNLIKSSIEESTTGQIDNITRCTSVAE